jgi:tRNA A37 N6-isopentenylltransferase MiaA
MKRRTRNYARRQLTWMRRLPEVREIGITNRGSAGAAADIVHILAAQPGEAPHQPREDP